MNYTIFDENGHILEICRFPNVESRDFTLAGQQYIEGSWSANDYYIANNQPVAKTARPSEFHDFDYHTKTWQLREQDFIDNIRVQRDHRLSRIDRVNPIWYSSLTAEQQQQLADYRQALLDVPQQAEWPNSVAWPNSPDWLE